jgi:hypothetical protein
VGRLATLFVGAITVGIGVILVGSAAKGLFEVMVTLFGLFVGPMLIPMLSGLLIPRVTARGAAAGIAAGFLYGFSLYLYRTLILAKRPGMDPNWLRYDFEAISILSTFAVTIAAMVIVTLWKRATSEELGRSKAFFERLATPIVKGPEGQAATEGFSPFYILSWITGATGLLLLGAGLVQGSGAGWAINFGAGCVLCLIGAGFQLLHRSFTRNAANAAAAAQSR